MVVSHQQTSQKFTATMPCRHILSLEKFFNEIHHHIPEKMVSKLLYIDLLQQALPTVGYESTSPVSLSALVNPLSPYFLEGSRAKTRHAGIFLRFLQNTHDPKVLLQEATPSQAQDCLGKIWQLAHNVQVHNTLVPAHIKERADSIIQEGVVLNNIHETKEPSYIQKALQWVEHVIEFANSYYSYCFKA